MWCFGGLGPCPHEISGFRPLETTFSSNLVTVFTGAGKSLMTCKFRREGEGRGGGESGWGTGEFWQGGIFLYPFHPSLPSPLPF